MIRNFCTVLFFWGLLLCSLFAQPGIKISMSVPEQVKAGEGFQVIVTIEKEGIQSFSRFQQDIPFGLTAERVTTANADFSFENQRIRFIWLKLPTERAIRIAYNIKVDERLRGSFKLEGEFSYIDGEQRKTITSGASKEIMIIPNPLISENKQVDIKDFEKTVISEKALIEKGLPAIRAERIKAAEVKPGEILVEIKVIKGSLDRFAKIEESIPEGFSAVEGDSKSGVFSFQDRVAKLLWMNLPAEPEFTISYKLLPSEGKSAENLNISGTFSYIEGNLTKSLDIIQKIDDLASSDALQGGKKQVDQKVTTAGQTTGGATGAGADHMLQPQKGVYFRIQLIALQSKVDISKDLNTLNLKYPVKVELHQGLMKYSVGSFSEYQAALDYCNYIKINTSSKQAFITAYNNGIRISVEDALSLINKR